MPAQALIVMVVGVLIAAISDVRTRRIPNVLTGALAAIAIVASATGGIPSIVSTILVMLATFAFGAIAFSLGWFGGGDVKLLAACAGFAGFPGSFQLLLFTLIAGGVVCLAVAIRERRLMDVLLSAMNVGLRAGTPRGQSVTVPYGVAIAAGACVYTLSIFSAPHIVRMLP